MFHLHKWKLIHAQTLCDYFECEICGKRKIANYSGALGNGYQPMKYPDWENKIIKK